MSVQIVQHDYEADHVNYRSASTKLLDKSLWAYYEAKEYFSENYDILPTAEEVMQKLFALCSKYKTENFSTYEKVFALSLSGLVKPYAVHRDLSNRMHDSVILYKDQLYMVISQGIIDDSDKLDVSIGLFKDPTLFGIDGGAQHETMSVERFIRIVNNVLYK